MLIYDLNIALLKGVMRLLMFVNCSGLLEALYMNIMF